VGSRLGLGLGGELGPVFPCLESLGVDLWDDLVGEGAEEDAWWGVVGVDDLE